MQELKENRVNIRVLSLVAIGVAGTAAYAIAFGARWWESTLFLALFGTVIAYAAGFRQTGRAS